MPRIKTPDTSTQHCSKEHESIVKYVSEGKWMGPCLASVHLDIPFSVLVDPVVTKISWSSNWLVLLCKKNHDTRSALLNSV